MRKFIFVGVFSLFSIGAFSQIDLRDTVEYLQPTAPTNEKIIGLEDLPADTAASQDTSKHSPRTAAILSAVLPGSGQVYNGSWWKTPIIYAGFAGVGYGLYFYQDYYKSFKTAYNNYRNPFLEKGETPPTDTVLTVRGESGYSPVNVQQGRDFYRKYRDLCIAGIGVWYILNILDAYVEAHLFEFDVSDDLTIQWQPFCSPIAHASTIAPLPSGVRFSVQF